jgi:hypothetical protein
MLILVNVLKMHIHKVKQPVRKLDAAKLIIGVKFIPSLKAKVAGARYTPVTSRQCFDNPPKPYHIF